MSEHIQNCSTCGFVFPECGKKRKIADPEGYCRTPWKAKSACLSQDQSSSNEVTKQ